MTYRLAQRLRRAAPRSTFDALGDGRHLHDRTDGGGNRDHRAGRRRSCRSRHRPRTPTSSWCCACSRPTCKKWCSRARSIRTPRSRQGWLRASHRKLDRKLTLPYRPYHTHDEKQPLEPGEVYELDIEIHPDLHRGAEGLSRRAHACAAATTSIRAAAGGKLSNMKNEFTGVGPFLHDDPRDRPIAIFGGRTTLHLGGGARISCCCRSFRPRRGAW